MWLTEYEFKEDGDAEELSTALLYPKFPVKQVPAEVPPHIAQDLREAHATFEISLKASAALSRRCVQNIIREEAGIKKPTLVQEIQELVSRKVLPEALAQDLDAIRNVGNFAAHPIKDQNTGTVMDVEPGEAEWLLEVLDDLIAFYYISVPERSARRDRLNQRLAAAGKPLLS